MGLFSRRKKDTDLEATSLEQYYANQNRGSALGWLLAIIMFLVALAVIVGLFFAARWVYRSLTDDETPQQTATQQTEQRPAPATPQPQPQPSPTPPTASPPPPPAAPPAETPTPPPATAPTTSSTSANNEQLPSSGPVETVLVFVAVSAAAGAAHYMFRHHQR